MSSKRSGPVCGAAPLGATPFLIVNIDPHRADELSYASRKAPEYMNLNLVQHVLDPKVIALAAFRLLRAAGAAFVTAIHGYRGWLNCMLGRVKLALNVGNSITSGRAETCLT